MERCFSLIVLEGELEENDDIEGFRGKKNQKF